MGRQQRPVLLLVAVAFFFVSLSLELVAASSASDFKHKGADKHGDSWQPGFRSNLVQFGSGNDRGSKGIELKPDYSNIKRVLGNKREHRKEAGGDFDKFVPLNRIVAGDSSRGGDVSLSAAGILGTLSEGGLEYVKDVLVEQVLDEVTPLQIPDITSAFSTPIGRIDATINNIYLVSASVYYSDIELGTKGITIYAAGIEAVLDAHWEYRYTAAYVPFPLGDGGHAEVKVTGAQAGVTCTLAANNGTLRLNLEEAGTYIENLEIVLHGGASWLYQWFVYALDYNIRAAIEYALTQQMVQAVEELDDWLLNLPRAVPIDDTSAIDVTVVKDPLFSPKYLSIRARGQFISLDKPNDYPDPDIEIPPGLLCDKSMKMVTIALADYVLNSAAFVYYDSGRLTWDVDSVPGQKYLNTASWRYIIPKLYKQYPNDDMILSFAVSSVPTVEITESGIRAQASADMTLEVKDGENVVPVACINLMVTFDAVASLTGANITGEATLDDLTLSLKWSEIGSFPVYFVQATVRALVNEFVVPLINFNLRNGFPIPMIAGVAIEDAELRYEDGYLLVCTNIRYTGGFFTSLKRRKGTLELHSKD